MRVRQPTQILVCLGTEQNLTMSRSMPLCGSSRRYPPSRSGMGPVAQQVFKTCAVW